MICSEMNDHDMNDDIDASIKTVRDMVSTLRLEVDSRRRKVDEGLSQIRSTEMILGIASRYACLEDLDKWAASRLQVGYKYSKWFTGLTLVT